MQHLALALRLVLLTMTVSFVGLLPAWAGADDPPAAAEPSASAPGTGSVEGTITYRADPQRPWRYARYYVQSRSGRLAETVVALSSSSLNRAAAGAKASTAKVDQRDFQFTPETVAIQAGGSVTFTNGDDTTHNVRAQGPLADFNVNTPQSGAYTHRFDRPGGVEYPVEIGCAYHGAMRAWVFVFRHPHFQITAADGRFRLTDVPPGEYTLQIVHPAGQLHTSQKVRVQANQATSVEVKLSPDDSKHDDSKHDDGKPDDGKTE